MSVEDQYRRVAAEVAAVCEQCGREPSDVRLIAVSKTVGPEGVAAAMEAGARDFGENRPDQLVARAAQFPEVRWHFIGNIQSRRIPDIVGAAALIHSLHTLRHGQKINEAAARLGTVQDVLVEVNVSGEASRATPPLPRPPSGGLRSWQGRFAPPWATRKQGPSPSYPWA